MQSAVVLAGRCNAALGPSSRFGRKKASRCESQMFLGSYGFFLRRAQKAAKEALVLARSFGGRVLFLHVLDLSPLYAYDSGGDVAVAFSMLELTPENFETDWEYFLSSLVLEKVVWEKHTEEGRAAKTIIERAAATHADAIVMGTHGRSGLEQMFLGSVAEAAARTAPALYSRCGLRRLSLDSRRWVEKNHETAVFLV